MRYRCVGVLVATLLSTAAAAQTTDTFAVAKGLVRAAGGAPAVVNPCGPFLWPLAQKPVQTTRNNTKGARQKLNRTNSFRHAPFQLLRV
jgi:hypothetical protein